MPTASLRSALLAICCGFALASCGGSQAPATPVASQPGGGSQPAASASLSLSRSAQPATVTVDGNKLSLGISSASAPAGATLSLAVPAKHGVRPQSGSSCSNYGPPSLDIINPTPWPITLSYGDLKNLYILFLTSCNVTGQGWNVALTPISPSSGSPDTIGDVIGQKIARNLYAVTGFVPRANASYTFAPQSTSLLSFIPAAINPATGYPYTDTQVVTFVPNTSSTLGSIPTASCSGGSASPSPGCPNGSSTQTGVALSAPSTSGGSASVVCFNTSDARYKLISPSSIAAFPGVVKGACQFNTGSGSVTLGTTVTFTITNPDPDTAHGLLEGPPVQVPCTQTTVGNTITATCPTTGPSGSGFTIGTDSSTQYQYFLFGNDPNTGNVQLSPSWVSVVQGTASGGYTFTLPTFPSYPVTLTINGDVNNNLSIAENSSVIPCPSGSPSTDMTQVSPHSLRVNCNSGHGQYVAITYNGGVWQYQHNGIPGQNQDCDAACVAYASIDLYDGTGTTLVQGDGPGATINGVSNAVATINPLAIIDPVTGALEDANAQTVNLPPADASGSSTTLKVTEANINALNDTSIVFNFTQPTNGALFGLNTYQNGASFVTSGSPALAVGSASGLAHIPWGVGLNIQSNTLGGTGLLFISPPEPAGQHAPPSGIISIGIPQASAAPEAVIGRPKR